MRTVDSRLTDLWNDGFHLHLPMNNEKLRFFTSPQPSPSGEGDKTYYYLDD